MSDVVVKVKKQRQDNVVPKYMTEGSAGCDVCSSETFNIMPGLTYLAPTGIHLEVPSGYECQVRPRSGLAKNHGIIVFNSPGTIDSDYRGEVMVLLWNTTRFPYMVKKGDRIGQLVFAPVTTVVFEEVEQLTESSRGEKGWGSSGKR